MKKIMILSGAGLSAESGIRTFRDAEGLWENHDVLKVCSTQGWIADHQYVTRFYNDRRSDLETKEPNHAHKVLARLEHDYRGRVIHLTQNIDNLMEKAGAKDVIHLHGTLTDLHCEACTETFNVGYVPQETISKFDSHSYIDEYFEHFIQKKAAEAMDDMMAIIKGHMDDR